MIVVPDDSGDGRMSSVHHLVVVAHVVIAIVVGHALTIHSVLGFVHRVVTAVVIVRPGVVGLASSRERAWVGLAVLHVAGLADLDRLLRLGFVGGPRAGHAVAFGLLLFLDVAGLTDLYRFLLGLSWLVSGLGWSWLVDDRGPVARLGWRRLV